MEKKLTCFVISPIGEAGSEIRRNADDLLSLIVRPALEPYGFEILRGDHRSEASQIDIDVIKCVQDSELCICDVSLPNINVFYELGRRDETGKPVVLLKAKDSEPLPVDIATRRYIEYDLDSRRGIIDSSIQIRNFVGPMVQRGFEDSGRAATLGELSEVLQRVERKLDRVTKKIEEGGGSPVIGGAAPQIDTGNDDPNEVFRLALIQRNVPLAEQAMEALRTRGMDRMRWLDLVVEQAAAMGSEKAGEILIASAQEFFDSDMSFKKKTEYLGGLVSFANKKDREEELLPLVEGASRQLEAESEGQRPEEVVAIYNQRNRLYFGIYINTKDKQWLHKAIDMLHKAYSIAPTRAVCFNLATCYYRVPDLNLAARFIDECISQDDEKGDADHLELACKIYYKLNDPRFDDALERLARISQTKAILLKRDLESGRA